jgi:FkbM family methyltransferase
VHCSSSTEGGDIKVLLRCVAIIRGLLGDEVINGRTLIDVGANVGTTIIPALLTFPFTRAVALEPEPENFITLRLNLVLNGLDDRATAFQVAASDQVGELDLVVNRSRSGKHWIATDQTRLRTVKSDERPIRVPVVTLRLARPHRFRSGRDWLSVD